MFAPTTGTNYPSTSKHSPDRALRQSFSRKGPVPDSMGDQKTLYVVVCAAGPASEVGTLVRLAQGRGWTVQVMATPSAMNFIDVEALEKQTGRPVRSQHRAPGDPRSPKADAIIIAPATFNTINKLANGIADNYVLDVVNEAIGLGVPTVILPFVNSAYTKRTLFKTSIEKLRTEDVPVMIGVDTFSPHEAGSGSNMINSFPWTNPLDKLKTFKTIQEICPHHKTQGKNMNSMNTKDRFERK